MSKEQSTKKRGEIIKINEGEIREHLGEIVRGSVEDTLNGLLDAEADRLCNARRYERTEGRKDYRAGKYERSLETKAVEEAREIGGLLLVAIWSGVLVARR